MTRLARTILLLIMSITALTLMGSPSYSMPSSGALIVNPASPDSDNAPQLKTFTITVSRMGFNGSSGVHLDHLHGEHHHKTHIQVNQGDRVRIEFVYGDGDIKQDNPHVMTIKGYNIETDSISKKFPKTVVEFIAGQTGIFNFVCSNPCIGMENLREGWIEVVLVESETLMKTDLQLKHTEIRDPNFLHAVALVTDEKGDPVKGVLLDFHISTTFGSMEIASNVTEADGSTELLYPLASFRETKVIASFRGSGRYLSSNTTVTITPYTSNVEYLENPYVSGQNTLWDYRIVGVTPQVGVTVGGMAFLVLGSVWITYVYVVGQLLRMKIRSQKKAIGGEE